MATQRRSWLARVGVVLAVAFGGLIGVTTPAFAAPSVVSPTLQPNTINVGQESTFRFKLKDNAQPPPGSINNVRVDVSGAGSCTDNCGSFNVDLNNSGESETQSVKIRGNSQGQAQVRVTVNGSALPGTSTLVVNQAQQAQETTGRLQGVVNNVTTGKPVQGAKVTLQDGAGKTFPPATTSAAGTYVFDGPSLKIAPGLIVVSATRDPLVAVEPAKSMQVAAGQNATLPALEMQDAAAPTPSVTATAQPTVDASGSPLPTTGAIDNASDDEGLDSMTWIMIIVGGVLVALGIGAIVLLLVRRKDDDEEEDEQEQPTRGRPGPRGPQPGYRPPPQPTQQYGGGGYRPADPTMVARPGMNDAPTMMHRPDPYGGQPTQQYGGQGQAGWAPQQQGGYGQASGGGAYGGQASGGGAYGGQASGGGAYGQPGYGGGYGQPPGYGANQYDEPTSYAGGAGGGGGGGGGYDQSGYGSGQGGYDQGYGQSDQYGQQGYQQDPYGQQGYTDDRRNRGDRRLDWLDD